MSPICLAVCLAAALLIPGGAAFADPPWTEGRGYKAQGCYSVSSRGSHGLKKQYRCERGPRYAGGPPPWAPAHGWRRKHGHRYHRGDRYEDVPYHEHGRRDDERVIVDLGIEFGRCDREVIGAVIGGTAGGVIGSQVGEGSDRTVATIGGTIIGVLVGGAIGRSMDEADQACIAQTLEKASARQTVVWSGPDGEHYRVVPMAPYEDGERMCRDYRTTATIEGRRQQVLGTACRHPDGRWRRVI